MKDQYLPPSGGPANRILVIEDDRSDQLIYRGCLEPDGYALTVASSGKEAFNLLDKDFGIAIVDLHLPDVPGTEVLERLNESGKPVAAIVISGFSDINVSIQALSLGAFWYLKKPIHQVELKHIVRRAAAYIEAVTAQAMSTDSGEKIKRVTQAEFQDKIEVNGQFLCLADVEREAIIRALLMTGGNKARAARLLDISEKSIYNKMDRLGIKRSHPE